MNTKKILGLDLGTNSIGWALVEKTDNMGAILGAGSRILPMSQDVLGKFDSGVSVSQTAERTGFRGVRRLRQRHLLRRERLHRVLNILGFLPKHYAEQIDFNKRLGQFLPEIEPKINYAFNTYTNKSEFLFKASFKEMLQDFALHQPALLAGGKKIPHDWTIYYLRKKALTQAIAKEELAWLLLHFNQKRGYYQLRGEEEEAKPNKLEEFYSLKVVDVTDSGDRKSNEETWYNVLLENGWIYRRTSRTPLDWVGKTKEFIVTTDVNDDGTPKTDKEGKVKRSFRAPADNDWTLVKKKTEHDIDGTNQTVGEYIYNTLLKKPNQKIKGKLVRTIERKYYKEELRKILETQQLKHPELQNSALYKLCLEELYENNQAHRTSIGQKGFAHLFLNDIIFYQRPLKSKTSLIADCKVEKRFYKDKNGALQAEPLKGIAKSHPLYQEFRLWKFISDLRILQREKEVNGRLTTDVDVTDEFIQTETDRANLFTWLNTKREIDQKEFLRYPAFNLKKNAGNYRWNYVEEKKYPCNETGASIKAKLEKAKNVPTTFLTPANQEHLWHILYSVEDKNDIEKALKTFAQKHTLGDDFAEHFLKFPPFKKEYGAYSAKAIKKLLPLMRLGEYWNEGEIHPQTRERIEKILTGEFDETIKNRVREKAIHLTDIQHFKGLPEWLASYIVYDRHAEDANAEKWATAAHIQKIPQHSLRNPIVEQVINEALQVVKDIWNKYGQGKEGFFDEIHIELGREMKNTKAEREKLTRQINENESTNLRIKALLAELINDATVENVRPYSPTQQEILRLYEEGVLSAEDGNIPDEILKISKQAQPTQAELVRYKLWLQQKYRSPYTGCVIPLNKLFTPAYEIEHIIPQSRYFDDSFSNKVICEAAVNKLKDNRTALEFIMAEEGRIVSTGYGSDAKILPLKDYEQFIKDHYGKSRGKMKRLLMEDVPESFIQRQMNDTRYISKKVKNLLSNIVRQPGEEETASKNIVSSSGGITAALKQDWGLNDIWNHIITPRFERLNALTNSNNFGEWVNKEGKRVFQTEVPLALQRGFSKKRIDHRHHALDAIIIACATRNHINYLNNISALGNRSKQDKETMRHDLRHTLCHKKFTDAGNQHYKWVFNKPWGSFTSDCKNTLESIVVSFKQNNRIINKTINYYQKWVLQSDNTIAKHLVKQAGADNWAIRKPLHKDTVSGLVTLRFKKTVALSAAIDNANEIVYKPLRQKIKQLTAEGHDKKKIIQFFKTHDNQWEGQPVAKTDVYYWDVDTEGKGNNAATRVSINDSFDTAMIQCITDTGIQQIMLNHLKKHDEQKNGKTIEHPELAFSPDGLDEMNKNIVALNNGKPHQPIFKARTFEPRGTKFNVGHTGNKKSKYVEAAKGTNLFFAIYTNTLGKRVYETIPLNIVVARLQQGLPPVPEKNELGNALLMYLSPNDLVYLPTEGETIHGNYFANLDLNKTSRIYKMVSASDYQCFFVRHEIATTIVNKVEFSPLNKTERSIEGIMIKDVCIKLKVDRLGNIRQTL